MTASDERLIVLEAPDTVRCGDVRMRCGGTVFRALRFLSAVHGGAALRELTREVWGVDEVKGETLRSLIFRANGVLKGIRCGRVVMLDGDRVLFE